jgi:ParB-like chromosome segregation protein Spo0J
MAEAFLTRSGLCVLFPPEAKMASITSKGTRMQVLLAKLEPNPTRDLRVDPIDPEVVKEIRLSIEEDGFWGGVVCNQTSDNRLQIAAGHHRVIAALEAGITRADLFVCQDLDRDMLMRIYSRENATQRGTVGTARAGSVAAAIRCILMDEFVDCGGNQPQSTNAWINSRGVGWKSILAKLRGVPGVNVNTIKQDLAHLKQSGHYSRILQEVADEVARRAEEARLKAEQDAADEQAREEAEEAAKAEKQAKETATKAKAENPTIFDFDGVSKYIKSPHQLDVFRDCVTKNKAIREALPVNRQASLARHLLKRFEEMHDANPRVEFSGTFIREQITNLVLNAGREARQHTKEEKERLLREDKLMRFREALDNFGGACRRMQAEGTKIMGLMEDWPKDLVIPISRNFKEDLREVKKIIDSLIKRI